MQETWGQAFRRRPLEYILLFTIGLPLLPFIAIIAFIYGSLKDKSDKKEFNNLVNALTKIETELRSSSQSKNEFLQLCFDQSHFDFTRGSVDIVRGELKTKMVEQVWKDLEQLGCDPSIKHKTILDAEKNAYEMANESVNRIFLNAETEIDELFKQFSLAENIPQTHTSEYGTFFNAYQDLVGVYETDYSQYSNLVKKAYGHARLELAAVLFLQGILSSAEIENEKNLFPNIDLENEDFDFWYVDDCYAPDLSSGFIDRYHVCTSGEYFQEYCNWQYAVPFVFNGKITSRIVGPTRRSQMEVLQLISRLEELDGAEDDFLPDSYCGSMNIYECLLGSNRPVAKVPPRSSKHNFV